MLRGARQLSLSGNRAGLDQWRDVLGDVVGAAIEPASAALLAALP